MTEHSHPRPVVLCVLDGWGHRTACEDNAICQARTPVWDRLLASAPHALLDASAGAVGLPEGQMGNSEVGHMNLGAGRVVLQDLPRIDAAIREGELERNPALGTFIERLRASGGTAHVMGLASPGGVHAHQDHIAALARRIAGAGVPVAVHAFLDGRDTPPKSALEDMPRLLAAVADAERVRVATVSGRFYAMDRDRRWERTERAWRLLVAADGRRAADPLAAIEASYREGVSDEFVEPTAIDGYDGMADGDGVLMCNFRADRARQILHALLDPDFTGFERPRRVRFAAALGMVSYSEALDRLMPAMFPPLALTDTLGEVVANAGLRQLRIAETEKYAHVTFFFNGGRETPLPGEDRILVPSPKVPTYDQCPEMSAFELTDRLVAAVEGGVYDFIVVNYANGDMVGHTGRLEAAIRAAEAVDACLGRLEAAVRAAGGALFITADHGNAELMRDPKSREPHTAHTMNLVPAVLVNPPARVTGLADGRLADVAPTLLELMDLPKPAAMTGRSLLIERTETRLGAAAGAAV